MILTAIVEERQLDWTWARERKVSRQLWGLGVQRQGGWSYSAGNVGLKGPCPLRWKVCFRLPH